MRNLLALAERLALVSLGALGGARAALAASRTLLARCNAVARERSRASWRRSRCSRPARLLPPATTTMAAAASSAAASSASITVTYKTLPSATQANVWLRWPYLVVCDGGLVQVFDAHTPAEGSRSAGDEAGSVGDSFLQCVHQFSLPRYHVGAAATGRGANVLHGLDVRAGCLVGGTASGLVLHVALPPSGGSLPTIGELVGHTKVLAI